jgi:DNA-binding PadR family transcriptional regulator
VYIEIIILKQLESGPKHGYEIKKDIGNILGKNFTINNNMLYPILKRFEDMGAVSKQVEQQEGKPNRHIYTMTSTGAELLFELLQDFTEETASNDNEFLVRIGLFDMLDLQTRKRILLTRRSAVEKSLSHLLNIVDSQKIDSQYPFPYRVIQFLTAQKRLELEWISQLEKDCGEI